MSTLMLLSGGNSVHRKFAEKMDMDTYLLEIRVTKFQGLKEKISNMIAASKSVPRGYDVIVCESCFQYPALSKKTFGINSKIINLAAGPMFYHLLSKRLSLPERTMLRYLMGSVDGHLVYGKYGAEILSKLKVKKPVKVVYPFVAEELRKELVEIKPNLESHTISMIAKMDAHNKGVDIAFKAMKEVVKKYPDAKLIFVTSSITDEEIKGIKGYSTRYIEVLRNVPKISDVYQRSALYIQPSRGDMFGVACLESMMAGVPCIVSKENGAKEVAEMVVGLDKNKLANIIMSYFEKSAGEKQRISEKCRSCVSKFNEVEMLSLFEKQCGELISAVVKQ